MIKRKLAIYSCLGMILCFIILIPIVNDYYAYRIEETLCATSLPENTQLIDAVSKAGKLTGNGNGMQYFGAILIQSELTLKQLEDFYSNYRKNEWEYLVANQPSREISVVEHESLHFSENIAGDGYYIVYSWGQGIGVFEMLDMRGH